MTSLSRSSPSPVADETAIDEPSPASGVMSHLACTAMARSIGMAAGSPSHNRTSAALVSRSASATPIASTSSSAARNPAVSTSTNGTPAIATGTSMTSRVVPAIGVTIARSTSANALIRLDLPAFGGPATTTRTPSRSGSTRGAANNLAMSAANAARSAANPASPAPSTSSA